LLLGLCAADAAVYGLRLSIWFMGLPVYGVYVPLARRFMDAFDKVAYFWGMDFGKLTNVDRVDFALPPDHPANAGLLSKGSIPARQHLYIGPTGYNMKPWVGKWYAPGTKDKDHLRQYGKQFDTIEFNTTHYRIPDYATVLRWREEVPSDFRFCPKVPQTISHSDNLGIGTDEMRIFTQNILELGEKLGVCFLQLPPFFAPKDQGRLLRFLDLLPTPLPLSIEVRHEAFFRPDATAEAFFSLLTERGIHAIITDVAGRRDVCHSRLSTRKVLIRFVGNGLHPSDYPRIEAWAERLRDWFAAGLEEAYFFTHQPDNLLSPELAAYCETQFKKAMPTVSMRGPKPLDGQQGTLF
jgi:uncharacterized protein YecE (DUF72 family)